MDSVRFYLDYNATTPLSKQVKSWLERGVFFDANPSSNHFSGKQALRQYNQSKQFILDCFEQDDKNTQIYFHSGASEAISQFIYSMTVESFKNNQNLLVLYSKLDHPCMIKQLKRSLPKHVNFQTVPLLTCGKTDLIALGNLMANISSDTMIAYHHTWVHNELGIVQPIEELEKISRRAYIYVDAVQVPKKIYNWQKISGPYSMITYSGHKFGSLKSIGFSFLNKNFPFHPLIVGGDQENFLRAGTTSVMGVQSMALALEDALSFDLSKLESITTELRDFLKVKLIDLGDLVIHDQNILNLNTIYFYLNQISSDVSLALFDRNGLMISAGAACSSGSAKESEILKALNLSDVSRNGLRISLGEVLEKEMIDEIKNRLDLIFNKLKR